MKEIILASASPRRRELLQQIGLEPKVMPSDVNEEEIEAASPAETVEKLALKKAGVVAETVRDGLVIGGDTLVVMRNRILGKPQHEGEAEEMLHLLSGNCHLVMSGLAIVDAETGCCRFTHDTTKVFFRKLSEAEIKGYIRSGEPFDKAGAYGIQGLGALLVERIEGCYFNVVGLPIAHLVSLLKQFGRELL